MGGEPRLALNILCLKDSMDSETVQEILRGGYSKAYEADTIITGGHTINGAEPLYGLSVSGFVHPQKVLTNSGARPGDVLILTKPLGIGILTTAAKADLVDDAVLNRIYAQMTYLNKTAAHIMRKYEVHSCTDVTGFSLMGHSFEMAQGSDCTIHFDVANIPYHKEAFEFAEMGFIPAGAYRNRQFAEKGVYAPESISRAMQDIMYDPQTSGGLLIAVSENDAAKLYHELTESGVPAAIIGYATEAQDHSIILK
jgi:selenide,water dikinase